ncbi:hypothetical protein GW17_00032593 [Ensete ventricosum]|nr:hypothetical protein GW17_00032593 [Ensete ventricosum]
MSDLWASSLEEHPIVKKAIEEHPVGKKVVEERLERQGQRRSIRHPSFDKEKDKLRSPAPITITSTRE